MCLDGRRWWWPRAAPDTDNPAWENKFYSACSDLSSDPNIVTIQETDDVGDANLVPIQVEAEGLAAFS